MKFRTLLLLGLLLFNRVGAQDEVVELSSFQVTSESDRGYASQQTAKPDVAVTLTKTATAVVMDVTIVNANDKAEDKNREVLLTIKSLERAVAAEPQLRFERREIQLRGEARRKSLFSRSSVTSFANVAIVAPVEASANLFATVDRMRGVVARTTPNGGTKVIDGVVYLMLERPEQYRKELLTAIFADIAFLKENLGPGFEVLPTGLDGAIQVRAASETKVELWIDYGLTIRSLVELQHPKPGKN